MTKQEFDKALNAIENEYSKAKEKLLIDYAIANNPCKVGDIIKDHIGKGKIIKQKVRQNYHDKYSLMVYECIELKMDGTPRKKENLRPIFQSNLKEINGKPYRYE